MALSYFIWLLMFLLGHTAGLTHLERPHEALIESAHNFDKGHYKQALQALKNIDIRRDFDNSDDMKLAFKIRAISYQQIGDSKKATETIRELLFVDPLYKFDPFDTPQTFLVLAQQEQAVIEEKNRELAMIKQVATKEAAPKSSFMPSPIIIKKPEFVTTLFPLGLNHFYLDQPIKGGIYLSLQSLSLLGNIFAFWWKQTYLEGFGKPYVKQDNLKYNFKVTQAIQHITLGTFIVSYAISIIDALIHFKKMTTQNLTADEITS